MCESGRSTSEVFTAVAVNPGIPRAVLEALFRSSPDGVTKPSFWERPFYPPLTDRSPDAPYLGYESPRPVGPVASGRDAGQLWLQPPIIACERQPATAPDPHMDSRGHAPLCGSGRVQDKSAVWSGDKFSQNIFALKSLGNPGLWMTCCDAAKSQRSTLRPSPKRPRARSGKSFACRAQNPERPQ
jgi:hypothetical protein